MSRIRVFDPTATRSDDVATPGPAAGSLAGKRIGFRVDRMWRAWDWVSELWADRFREAGAEVVFWRSGGRSGAEGERHERDYLAFLDTIDVAVVGLANCGSCTGWTVRDAITAANRGLPTTAVATANFDAFAHELAARGGRSGLRVHVLPYPLNEQSKADVQKIAETAYGAMLKTMGAEAFQAEAAE